LGGNEDEFEFEFEEDIMDEREEWKLVDDELDDEEEDETIER